MPPVGNGPCLIPSDTEEYEPPVASRPPTRKDATARQFQPPLYQ